MNAAHLHLLLNHIPVLGALGGLALFALAMVRKDHAIVRLTFQFMVLIGILSVPVYLTGEPAEDVIEHLPGVIEALIEKHETYAFYSLISTEVLALIGVMGLISLKKGKQDVLRHWKPIAAVALVNASLMAVTANYGGEIRHTEIRKDGAISSIENESKSEARESEEP